MTINPVPTITTGDMATATYMNTYLRDNMTDIQVQINAVGATLTSWTPVVTQSATITNTIVEARYVKIGNNVCFFWVDLSLTSAGTASNNITMSLPLTSVGHGANAVLGAGEFVDASVPTTYNIVLHKATTTTVKLSADAGTNGTLGQTLNAAPATTAIAVASGDFLRAFGMFTWA